MLECNYIHMLHVKLQNAGVQYVYMLHLGRLWYSQLHSLCVAKDAGAQ